MTPQEFVEKWRRANLSERSACQQHFLDLCEVLDQPKPAAADPDGEWYTFERGAEKADGGHGWADVWMRGHFGWEYKRRHRDLKAAYKQLQLYREDLENPPLLVVCDMNRFEVHTNFTGTAKKVYSFDLDGLATPSNLSVLRKLFTDPDGLKPGETTAGITEQAAKQFGAIAAGLRDRDIDPQAAAHFAMKLIFCMFGEDIELLPDKVFTSIVDVGKRDPARMTKRLRSLFLAMTKGGDFGAIEIPYFNGGLFAEDEAFDLTRDEIEKLSDINEYDWSAVEPSIFGTLFERTLDPKKRAQIGAHYTSRDDILTLLEPVIMTPLRREWDVVQSECDGLWTKIKAARPRAAKTLKAKPSKLQTDHDRLLQTFVERLAHVTVLDPACGSGNFLYVAINLLLDLEKSVIAYGATHGASILPQVRPTQLHGIEINPYAQQLAQVVIWIGYLQWKYLNVFPTPRNPVLEPIESIRLMDAAVDKSDPNKPKVPKWPNADFIVGNPPFLGGKLLRTNLGDDYVDALFAAWDDRVPKEADLCCYWFERARQQIASGKCLRAGLLGTQGIRGGANRKVLAQIKKKGDIFFAVSDRDWILDGANVHISMVGFDNGSEAERILDGTRVSSINANLTTSIDVTTAKKLRPNRGRSFQGPVKVGEFEIDDAMAISLLTSPNPNGRPTSDVIRPWINGIGITSREPPMWIIDFSERSMDDAAGYESAFERIREVVKPSRDKVKRERRRKLWWIHGEVNNKFRTAVRPLSKYLAICQTAKHFMFVWLDSIVLPGQTVIAIMDSSDEMLAILQSRVHRIWAMKLGTRLETRPRYTPTTCFDAFPFPVPTDTQKAIISAAGSDLNTRREIWLNPPEWTRTDVVEFSGAADGPWARFVNNPNGEGIGTVRYSRTVAKDSGAAIKLADRTMTNLYNEWPTWLDLAHKKLDEAVFAAYGWPVDISDDELLSRLLALNLERAKEQDSATH